MPVDYSKYPSDWKQISKRIREREGQRCKFCGAPNHTYIVRSNEDMARYIVFDVHEGEYQYPDGTRIRMSEIPEEFDGSKDIKVILTVAHLNHDTTDNRDENLAALCQLCHLRYDAKYHAANAKATRAAKKVEAAQEAGQMSLFGDVL